MNKVLYEEVREDSYKDYDLEELYNIYGKEKLNGLIEDYKEHILSQYLKD